MRPRFNLLGWVTSLLALALAVGGCSTGATAPNTSATNSSTVSANFGDITGTGFIGTITIGPQSETNNVGEQLKAAASQKATIVLAYNLLDDPKQEVRSYLDMADSLGLKVMVHTGDFLDEARLRDVGPDSIQTSPSEVQAIQTIKRRYGTTPDEQLEGMVREFQGHPAVWGFLATNNLASTANEERFQEVTRRIANMKSVTDKPFLVGGDILIDFADNDAWVREQVAFVNKMRSAGVGHLMFNCRDEQCSDSALQKLAKALQDIGYKDGWVYGLKVSDEIEFAKTARAHGLSNILVD